VTNGNSLVGTVTLSGAAPAGGQTVRLSAAPGDFVALPSIMTIKAGATSGRLNIQTKTVIFPEEVIITAKLNGSQQTALLTVNPTLNPTACPYTCRSATMERRGFRRTPNWVAKCGSDEVAENRVTCPPVTQTYSCGFLRRRECSTQVSSVCCKPKK